MPRILHCIPSMAVGGAERQLALLAGELVRRGWQVHVAMIRGGKNLPRLEAAGASVHFLEASRDFDPRIGRQLETLIRTLDPDLVQTWLTWMDIRGGRAAREANVPWILSECSLGPIRAERFSPLKNVLRVRTASGAAAVISISNAGDAYWGQQVGPGVRGYVIGNLLPLDEIDLTETAPRPVDGGCVILYTGRMAKEKNLDVLAVALQSVLAEVPGKAWLCGNGPRRKKLQQTFSRCGLADRVLLPGYVEEVWSRMKAADVFVSVSTLEGRPTTVMEAMACGTPVVVSDIPAHREFLDESTAVFCDPSDARAVSAAICSVLGDPSAARGRATSARERARQWSASAMGERYDSAYREILAAAGGR